jgi:hypothetical protein
MSTEESHKTLKQGAQHYLVFLALVGVLSFGFYEFVIPVATKAALVSFFQPHEKKLHDRFFEIKPGLMVVTTDAYKPGMALPETGIKPYIKTDFIFDFTRDERDEKADGYQKASGEWIVRANTAHGGLGEAAIILEQSIGFSVLSIALGFTFAIFITFFLPANIGFMAFKVMREIHHTKSKVRLQTGFSDEIVDLLTMPDSDLAALEPHQVRAAFRIVWDRTAVEDENNSTGHGKRLLRFEDVFTPDVNLVEFRAEALYLRIKEFFSDFVLKEITDTTAGIEWSRNRSKLGGGLRLYMAHHFTEKYANNTTGLAYFGAAILIVIIGVRGLKFIPATKPSLILAAISLEGALLALLAFGLVYTEHEERTDKMMKKLEDANKSQLETMKDVSLDMHKLADALVGETSEIIKKKVEEAIAEALASDDNVKRVVSDKVAEKIIIAMRESFPGSGARS